VDFEGMTLVRWPHAEKKEKAEKESSLKTE
jgi:hypothetical protein